jgi:putative ABC transport system permease protein
MRLTAELAFTQLKEKRKRTILTLLGIVLSVAMITAVFGFVASGRDAMYDVVLSQGNYHIGYIGVTPEDADILATAPEFESSYTEKNNIGNFGFYARLKAPTGDDWQTLYDIAERYGIEDFSAIVNRDLLALEGYVPDAYTTSLFVMAGILSFIIISSSIIVISNAFRVSAAERTRQFGILKSVGATSKQIRASVIYEGMFLAIIGIPIGLIVGLGIEYVGVLLADYFLVDLNRINDMKINLEFSAPWWALAFAIALAFVTIFLSAYFPARKAAKISAIDAIRGTGTIKLKHKKVRSSFIIRKIFGVEGELAAKSMKRSSKSHRATVLALSSSVILFLVGNSFGESMITGVGAVRPNIKTTVETYVNSHSPLHSIMTTEKAREITQQFRDYDKSAEIVMIGENLMFYNTKGFSGGNKKYLSEMGKKTFDSGGSDTWISFIVLDDDFYKEICKKAGAKEGENIILNQVNLIVDGKHSLFSPFVDDIKELTIRGYKNVKDGSDYLFEPEEEDEIIKIGGTLNKLPSELIWMTDTTIVYIVTPNSEMTNVRWLVNVKDAAGFAKFSKEILDNNITDGPIGGVAYNSEDIKAMTAARQGFANLIMVFIYGFIAMLTLIGFTNVVSTISTNINLRKREFAVLMSMGMTQKGINKMLNFESIIYGIRSIFFGLIIGLLFSYVIYKSMTDIVFYPYNFPIIPVLIAVVAVLVVTFTTMRFATSKIKKSNIIESIRQSE